MPHETLPHCNAEAWLKHHTHGHVVERRDGEKARCGGPRFCDTCQVEHELQQLIEECRVHYALAHGLLPPEAPPGLLGS